MTILKALKICVKLPVTALRKSLILISSLSNKGASSLQNLPKRMQKKSIFKLISLNKLKGFEIVVETPSTQELIILPKIVGLSNGGSISVNMPGSYLCKLSNVSFVTYSDFIRSENNVANEKLLLKAYDVLIPRDSDLIEINGKAITLATRKNRVYSKIGFNLMGTYSFQWAHFLAQYYPKLAFLSYLPKSTKIDLIVPQNIDPHIKYLIDFELVNYPDITLLKVDTSAEIFCEQLYHVSLGTLLGDEGNFPTPFDSQISNSTIKYWDEKASQIVPENLKKFRKIFIGRRGNRNLNNYDEILNYFIEQGFEEVLPHLLSMEEKVKIFGEVKYIVGPGSSGFTNSIFSAEGTKILAFINSFRYLDTYLAGFHEYKKQHFWFMSGKDDDLKHMNSSYTINLDELKSFLEEENFFDK